MVTKAKELLKSALALSPSERAELAGLLIESLDAGADEDVDAAWRQEIERRIKELEDGAVSAVPWEEARRRLIQGLDA